MDLSPKQLWHGISGHQDPYEPDYQDRLIEMEDLDYELEMDARNETGIEVIREITEDDIADGVIEFGYSMSAVPMKRGFNDDVLFEPMNRHKIRKFKG